MSDYAAVRAAYLQGGRANSLPKLAAKFRIPLSTLGLDVQRVEVAAGAPAVEVGAAVADARLAAIVARADARDRLADRLVTFRGEDTDDEARAILASIVEATA